MRIPNTSLGLFAQRNYAMHNNKVAKAIERISSGYRINRAADDPAGLCISERMKAKLSSLKSAKLNATMDISNAQIRDGTLQGMQSMLSRMKELATQAASGTFSDSDREMLDKEYQQLMDELSRVGLSSGTGQITILEGMKELEESAADHSEFSQIEGEMTITGGNLGAYLDALNEHLDKINKAKADGDNETLSSLHVDMSSDKTESEKLKQSIVEFTKNNADKLLNTPVDNTGLAANYSLKISVAGGISVENKGVSADSLALGGTDLLTQENATKAMDAVEKAMKSVASQLGDVGALTNQLERTLKRLEDMEINTTDALSRIMDADIAKEMMVLTKEKILAQAASFAMIHVNQQAEEVLHILGIAQ